MKLFLLIIVLVGAVSGRVDDLTVIDSIEQTESCRKGGGWCVIERHCPKGYLKEEKGLCTLQRDQGIECCNTMSVKETRCEKRGGSCTSDFCAKVVVYSEATDCPYGTQCCIYV